MRLFVALSLPKRERQRLHKAAASLRTTDLPVRWVEPDGLHLTLKFLGEVAPDRVPKVRDALAIAASKSKPFRIDLGGFGAFPSLRKPRVIWAGAYASPELRCLKHDLEWELASLGFEREARAFHPHLTLGRARADASAGSFRDLEELVAPLHFQGTLAVRHVDLLRSTLSSDGARYDRIASAELGYLPAMAEEG